MNYYNQLAKYTIFKIDTLEKLTGNTKTAYSQLERLMEKGLIKKVRNNIYSAVNPINNNIIATKHQIACAITRTAYISHHSAFEYYGLANKSLKEIYVSSETKFNHFEYDNTSYKFVASKMQEGIVEGKTTKDVRITDLERTVIECIHDYRKAGGFYELLNCLGKINYLDEDKLIRYLEIYNTQGLYQRVGYLLVHFKKKMHLSNSFINYCKGKTGKSRQYLLKEAIEDSIYNNEWGLMVPQGFLKGGYFE